jgi:high-affinity iron transporter
MEVRGLFDGPLEPLFEGSVMIISAFFVTWAVFFLHKTFAKKKLSLLQTVQSTINTRQKQGIMSLVFFAVLREGLEIVLFLSTIFFSSTPVTTGIGFALGAFFAIGISYLLFTTTIRIPVFYAFRFTTLLLILFAAGMFAQGYHELAEVHVLPSFSSLPAIPLPFLPDVSTVLGSAIKSLFGLTKSMHPVELSLWVGYTTIVGYLVLAAPLREESEE